VAVWRAASIHRSGSVGQVRVGVLASGSGTLLDFMLTDGIPVEVVLVDRPCTATEVAARHGVAAEQVERESFGATFDRDAYTDRVLGVLDKYDIDLAVMAGFGTVIPSAPARFPGTMINTHPALLPAFKGWHAVRDALAAGVKVTGCTVHIVTAELDEGPILAQEPVPVLDGDTEDSLHERIKEVERRLLTDTVRHLLSEGERR
jgi:phosphoribosylglycinamide formyltransferase-1